MILFGYGCAPEPLKTLPIYKISRRKTVPIHIICIHVKIHPIHIMKIIRFANTCYRVKADTLLVVSFGEFYID